MAPTNLNPRLLAGDESPPRVHARQFVPGSLAGGPAEYIARFAHGRSIPNPFDIDELDSAIDREAAMTSSASSQREMAQPDSDSSLMTPTFETETDSESTSTMPEFLTNELPSAPSWAREPTNHVAAVNSSNETTPRPPNTTTSSYDAGLLRVEGMIREQGNRLTGLENRLAGMEQSLSTILSYLRPPALAAVLPPPPVQTAQANIFVPLPVRFITFDGSESWTFRGTITIDAQHVASCYDAVQEAIDCAVQAHYLSESRDWEWRVFIKRMNDQSGDHPWEPAGERAIKQFMAIAVDRHRMGTANGAEVLLKVMVYKAKDEENAHEWIEGTYYEEV